MQGMKGCSCLRRLIFISSRVVRLPSQIIAFDGKAIACRETISRTTICLHDTSQGNGQNRWWKVLLVLPILTQGMVHNGTKM